MYALQLTLSWKDQIIELSTWADVFSLVLFLSIHIHFDSWSHLAVHGYKTIELSEFDIYRSKRFCCPLDVCTNKYSNNFSTHTSSTETYMLE